MNAEYIIRPGDKIFVRVMHYGQYLKELTLTGMHSLTEVLGEVREMAKGTCGLVNVIIRNYDRGWSVDRPLRLYGHWPVPKGRRTDGYRLSDASMLVGEPIGRMSFPWETH